MRFCLWLVFPCVYCWLGWSGNVAWTGIKKGKNMKNENHNGSTLSYVSAFLIGVILFWSFGKNWLGLESPPIFLAGLIGVALAVLAFCARNIYYNSHHKGN